MFREQHWKRDASDEVSLLIGLVVQPAVHGEVIRFDRAAKSEVPPDWVVAMTNAGGSPQWEVVRDDSARHPPMVCASIS